MAQYFQQTTPPPNKSYNFTLNDFSGGINNTSELPTMNQATDILNMAFNDDAVLEKRKGTELHSTIATTPIQFLDVFSPYVETDKLVYATDTKFYIDGVQVATTTQAGLGVNYNGKYFFADGNKLYAYGRMPVEDSTYVRTSGIQANENRLWEIRTPTPGFIPLDSSHTQGVTYYDYTASIIMYEPCALEISDTYKGSNVVPDDVQFLVSHKGRLFVSGAKEDNDNVFITDISNPYYFPVYLPLQVSPNSDKIRGLTVYDDAVLVGRANDIHAIHGNTNRTDAGETFRLRKLNTHTGFANHQAINVSHNYLFFVGYDGNCYAITSVNQSQNILSTTVLNQQLDFRKAPFSVIVDGALTTGSIDSIRKAKSFFHDDLWYVSIGSKVGVYSYRTRGWTIYDGWNARSFSIVEDIMLFGNDKGELVKLSENYNDLGRPYEGRWSSKRFDMDDPASYKQFREFFAILHVFDVGASHVRFKFEIDYVDVEDELEITSSISKFGVSKFGDRFITRNIMQSSPFNLGRRGRFIKITFSNSWTPSPDVYTVTELDTIVGRKSNSTLVYSTLEGKFFLYKNGTWIEKTSADLFQTMRIYQISGDYEFRGKR